MPRVARFTFEGALHHLTSRGVNRRVIFRHDRNRLRFLDYLSEEIRRQGWI